MITAQTIITVVILYLVIINVVGYVIMGVDKKRAIRGAWRISEASLFFTALLGGSLGCILGMQHFRHKTKHWYFKYGMPPHGGLGIGLERLTMKMIGEDNVREACLFPRDMTRLKP